MTTISGRGVKIEVALTFDSPLSITGLTAANPGVATLTAHGLTDGEVGYWSVTAGMVDLHEQATMVDNKTDNDFELAGLDTTDYGTWDAGTFTPAATWGLIEEGKGYAIGGGAADSLDDSRVHRNRRTTLAGLNAAEDLRINMAPPEVEGAALAFVMNKAKRGLPCLFKITKIATGKVLRVAYGVPSVYDENLDVGGLATGGFSVICPNFVLKPNV